MKKILLAITLMLTSIAYVFAGDEKINQQVVHAFSREFSAAQDAAWQSRDNYYRVDFNMEGERMVAFYSTKAELLGVTRHILSTKLPGYLQKSLKKDYASYWITDLLELSNEEGLSYYVTLQNADETIILESKDSLYWTLFR